MTYDQWKTTDPGDYYASTCERCGGYLRFNEFQRECADCADEFLAEEAFMAFYALEPIDEAGEHASPVDLTEMPS